MFSVKLLVSYFEQTSFCVQYAIDKVQRFEKYFQSQGNTIQPPSCVPLYFLQLVLFECVDDTSSYRSDPKVISVLMNQILGLVGCGPLDYANILLNNTNHIK